MNNTSVKSKIDMLKGGHIEMKPEISHELNRYLFWNKFNQIPPGAVCWFLELEITEQRERMR